MNGKLVYEQKAARKTEARKMALSRMNGVLIGCRIPKDYFITKGHGESDITIHAGSYHLALRDAGIEMCNLVYVSKSPDFIKFE